MSESKEWITTTMLQSPQETSTETSQSFFVSIRQILIEKFGYQEKK